MGLGASTEEPVCAPHSTVNAGQAVSHCQHHCPSALRLLLHPDLRLDQGPDTIIIINNMYSTPTVCQAQWVQHGTQWL